MSLNKSTEMGWDCAGCKTRIKIEIIYAPERSGAMSTVDCPICGNSKMIPDTATRLVYLKDGAWVEAKARSSYN